MKILIRLEELAGLIFSIYLFSLLPYPWWFYFAFFLVPDISMVGYLINPRYGAAAYNLVHHKAVALALFMAGMLAGMPLLAFSGSVLLGHTCLDRVLGYGLKYPDSFSHTHLGNIGRGP